VARCEQTSVLAEAEGASVARRKEGGGPDGFGLARPRMRARECSTNGRLCNIPVVRNLDTKFGYLKCMLTLMYLSGTEN
jgi:hypothetical protein